jgi:gliding motility-associated-like protein
MQVFSLNGAVPQAVFSVQGGTDICSGTSVTITNNSTVDVGTIVKLEIYWDYTNDPTNKQVDDTPAPGTNYTKLYPEFFTPASRTYTVRVVAYSGENCLHTSTQTITVKARPQLQFDAVPSVCADVAPFQLTQARLLNGLPGNGQYSGPGVSATGMFDPKAAGNGEHTLRYTFMGDNGCEKFVERLVRVFEVPKADAGPDRVVLQGGSVTLVGSGTGPGLTYLWTPATALNNPAIAQPSASPVADMNYTFRVTTSDGCTSTDQVSVKLLKTPTIPNVFTPNGDGINDKWSIQYLETYPGCTVQVYNRYGQLIFESKGYSKPWDGTRSGKELPAGTYYYIIDPKNGRQQMTGFVDIVR